MNGGFIVTFFSAQFHQKRKKKQPEHLGANLRFLALRADGKEQGCDAPRQILVTLIELPSHHVPTAVWDRFRVPGFHDDFYDLLCRFLSQGCTKIPSFFMSNTCQHGNNTTVLHVGGWFPMIFALTIQAFTLPRHELPARGLWEVCWLKWAIDCGRCLWYTAGEGEDQRYVNLNLKEHSHQVADFSLSRDDHG